MGNKMAVVAECNRLIKEYVKRFHENFPLYWIGGTEEDILKTLKECLATGKPVELEDVENRLY